MIPFQINYRNTKDGSGGLSDFDLPYAYQDLNSKSIGSARSVWMTALWVNFLTGGLSIVIGYVMWTAYQYDPFSHQNLLVAKIVIGVVGFLFCCMSIFLGIFSLLRGRLVLDKELGELRFYRFWFSFRPHRRILIDDIEALSHRTVCSPGDSHEPGRDYDILIAKLKDKRLASIAINSPYSIENELMKAIGLGANEPLNILLGKH